MVLQDPSAAPTAADAVIPAGASALRAVVDHIEAGVPANPDLQGLRAVEVARPDGREPFVLVLPVQCFEPVNQGGIRRL